MHGGVSGHVGVAPLPSVSVLQVSYGVISGRSRTLSPVDDPSVWFAFLETSWQCFVCLVHWQTFALVLIPAATVFRSAIAAGRQFRAERLVSTQF